MADKGKFIWILVIKTDFDRFPGINYNDLKILGYMGNLNVKMMKVFFKCLTLWPLLSLTFSLRRRSAKLLAVKNSSLQ